MKKLLMVIPLVILFCFAVSCKQEGGVSKPEAPPMSIERKFVSIDKGFVFDEGDQDVVRCKYLTKTLGGRFNTTNNEICDKTVMARDLLKNKYGVYEDLMNMLEDMNKINPTVSDPDYVKYIVGYVNLRKDGYSRQSAIKGTESRILEMGYSLSRKK